MALIAQLGEHCTVIAEVVGSNPVQSLFFFQVFVSVVLRLHSHLISLFIRLLLLDINYSSCSRFTWRLCRLKSLGILKPTPQNALDFARKIMRLAKERQFLEFRFLTSFQIGNCWLTGAKIILCGSMLWILSGASLCVKRKVFWC